MPKRQPPDWHPVRELATRVLRDREPLKLTASVVAILRSAAQTVGISEAETNTALRSVRSARALLRKIREDRIRKGSNRLGDALHRMYKLRDAGDLEGAREQMSKVLAVEVVPFYRWIAQGQLEQLEDWKPRPAKGRLDKRTGTKATKPKKPAARKSGKAGKAQPRKAPPREP